MNFSIENGMISLENETGEKKAFVTYSMVDEATVCVNKTFVDDSLRGMGIAGKLMEKLYEELMKKGYKAVFTCSYAKDYFSRHPEYAGILKENA